MFSLGGRGILHSKNGGRKKLLVRFCPFLAISQRKIFRVTERDRLSDLFHRVNEEWKIQAWGKNRQIWLKSKIWRETFQPRKNGPGRRPRGCCQRVEPGGQHRRPQQGRPDGEGWQGRAAGGYCHDGRGGAGNTMSSKGWDRRRSGFPAMTLQPPSMRGEEKIATQQK